MFVGTYCTVCKYTVLPPATRQKYDKQNISNADILYLPFYSLFGYAVEQMFKELLYKPEGCGFDSRLDHRDFPLT